MFSSKSSTTTFTESRAPLQGSIRKNAVSMFLLLQDNQGKAFAIFGMYCALAIVFAAAARHASSFSSSGCVPQVSIQVIMGVILCVGIALTCLSVKQVEGMRRGSNIDSSNINSTIRSTISVITKRVGNILSGLCNEVSGDDRAQIKLTKKLQKQKFIVDNGITALVAPVFIVPSVFLTIGMCFSIASCASGNSYLGTVSSVCNGLGAALMLLGACLVGAGIAYDEYTKCSAQSIFRDMHSQR